MEGASQERGQVRGIRRFAPDTPDCMVLGFRRRLRLQPSCSLPLCGGEWEARKRTWEPRGWVQKGEATLFPVAASTSGQGQVSTMAIGLACGLGIADGGRSMFEVDGTEVERSHLQKLSAELEALATANWDSIPILSAILVELLFRRRSLALQLRARVVQRIIDLQSQAFSWPSTDAPAGSGRLGDTDWPNTSLLKFMGYAVGQNGAADDSRRAILDYVYTRPVPQVVSREYMSKWGSPKTGKRLKQMAENIAASTRNAKHNPVADFGLAIAEWEFDLEYLRITYYVDCYDSGRSYFRWPGTSI